MLKRHSLLAVSCLLVLALACGSCTRTPRKYTPKSEEPAISEQMPMPRADPAYLQYLERQSMLMKSTEMAKVVSGSELAWRASASSGAPDAMLNFADNWLLIHPLTILTSSRSSTFAQLSQSSTWPVMREVGLKGLYVAPVQGGGGVWGKGRKTMDTGDDVVQYDFSRAAGKDGDYRRLMSGVIDNNALLGSDLVPAATGLGPDFFLAARNVREYPGVYCMVEIPEKLWVHLPDVTSEWEGAALGESQVAALNAQGLLPKSMRDEVSPLARMGGWAATGLVRGVDGNNYRWVYRYYQSPEYAVLNWEDPSQTAHRILSGSAVRQVGLQGQALLGLRFEAFQGLEAAPESRRANSFSVEPARTAAQSMSREIRRYGGWSWVRDDDLPLHSVKEFLYGSDFIFDSVFSPSSEHALLTGDASFARFMADEALRLGIDMRRLVHVMPNQDGINYSLPHLSYIGGEKATSFRRSVQGAMRAVASQVSPVPVQDSYLYCTAPGLAALALNASTAATAEAQVKEIEKGHGLLIFFKAMQPGALMLAGQDLAGVLPLNWSGMVSASGTMNVANSARGGYGLNAGTSALPVTVQGMPRAPQLYGPPDVQVHLKDSFLSKVGSFLRPRTQYGIAKGTLIARPETKGKGSIALVTRLADGQSHLVSVCNFSRETVTETISLASVPASVRSRVTPIALGGSHSVSGASVKVTLGPWQGRALLFGSGEAVVPAEDGGATMRDNEATPIPAPVDIPEVTPAPQPDRRPKPQVQQPGEQPSELSYPAPGNANAPVQPAQAPVPTPAPAPQSAPSAKPQTPAAPAGPAYPAPGSVIPPEPAPAASQPVAPAPIPAPAPAEPAPEPPAR